MMNALVKSAASRFFFFSFHYFFSLSLEITPLTLFSEKVSEVLDDVLELCGSAHYRLNPTNEVRSHILLTSF